MDRHEKDIIKQKNNFREKKISKLIILIIFLNAITVLFLIITHYYIVPKTLS